MAQTKIILTAPHTHAGQQYQAGETLELDESSAEFILKMGAGKATATRRAEAPSEETNNGAQ
ncbi:DUF7210 family protein [Aggregatibacter aphrophilus]|uniref:DUF7210 domain-containing protein n=2 Tax=Aggregatibacter aphrophilus TaxID=732 RepID=A0A336N748_AGGAP|nr:hypothetical protein [Aggregatibacter aphrophilus]KNE84438.1 hypothetical protein ATCC33389_0210900 [Aggregatibacter aphrophilus ATCC 33389]OBY54762.1 hypothetical protein BBB51_04080 [Aggregatibacter aphrophilus]SSY93952.1 Uncharacterised protein [Aggregatibacter aphrophilus]VEF41204.1 Uncharacterised protein [Aggregatibacter aphrophilus ATCC 33389]